MMITDRGLLFGPPCICWCVRINSLWRWNFVLKFLAIAENTAKTLGDYVFATRSIEGAKVG